MPSLNSVSAVAGAPPRADVQSVLQGATASPAPVRLRPAIPWLAVAQCVALPCAASPSTSAHRGLTRHSTGPSTACQPGPVGGTQCIIAVRPWLPCRGGPVSSNVRRRNTSFPIACAHRTQRVPSTSASCQSASFAAAQVRASRSRRMQALARTAANLVMEPVRATCTSSSSSPEELLAHTQLDLIKS
jgi:hypothetical protein